MTIFRKANPALTLVLHWLGGTAIALPWGRAYFTPDHFANRQTRRHELQHLRQIKAEGPIKFSVLYLYYLTTTGYDWNPYEVAARIGANEAKMQPGYENNPELMRIIGLTTRCSTANIGPN